MRAIGMGAVLIETISVGGVPKLFYKKRFNVMASVHQMLRSASRALHAGLRHPKLLAGWIRSFPDYCRGVKCVNGWPLSPASTSTTVVSDNPLWQYFTRNTQGPGIWKWSHYFDAYHRHLAKFQGRSVNVVEIGIYSGGSLGMWASYFGPTCAVFGVDIEAACKVHAKDGIEVFIGDQGDPIFWANFRKAVPEIHVVIDDGGHTPEQQMTTLEQILPHLPAGGVYICEDIHGRTNRFTAFAIALVNELNGYVANSEGVVTTNRFQRAIRSIHFYPYLLVIEVNEFPTESLAAPRCGTEWQPFL